MDHPSFLTRRMVGGGRPLLPEIGCQLVLITNRKSHTGFRLVPTLVTLNDLELIIAAVLHYFTEFHSFWGLLCHSGWW